MFDDLLNTDGNDYTLYTEKCIVCLKPAITFTGHVLNGNDTVVAGWCKKHTEVNRPADGLLNRVGCYGGWHPEYGIEKICDNEEV